MQIVVDTSALLAVILGEPERDRIVQLTVGQELIGPGSIPWEVGNAFLSMLKRKRINLEEAQLGVRIFQDIPLRYVPVDIPQSVVLAHKSSQYAYDAYFLDCCQRHGAPLLTLDRALIETAKRLKVKCLEV
jgi:predicted nucleic acid-binding protein